MAKKTSENGISFDVIDDKHYLSFFFYGWGGAPAAVEISQEEKDRIEMIVADTDRKCHLDKGGKWKYPLVHFSIRINPSLLPWKNPDIELVIADVGVRAPYVFPDEINKRNENENFPALFVLLERRVITRGEFDLIRHPVRPEPAANHRRNIISHDR